MTLHSVHLLTKAIGRVFLLLAMAATVANGRLRGQDGTLSLLIAVPLSQE